MPKILPLRSVLAAVSVLSFSTAFAPPAACADPEFGDLPAQLTPRKAIETDPLAWLGNELSCEQLTDQIKARYSPLGKFSDLPPGTKAELRQVLDIACSPRFAQCRFSSCGKLANNDEVPAKEPAKSELSIKEPSIKKPDPGAADSVAGQTDAGALDKRKAEEAAKHAELEQKLAQNSANEKLAQLFEDYRKSREKVIASLKEAEAAGNLSWQRIQMAEEVQHRMESGERRAKAEVKNVKSVEQALSSYNNQRSGSHAPLIQNRGTPAPVRKKRPKREQSEETDGSSTLTSAGRSSPSGGSTNGSSRGRPPPPSRGF